jgi:hypothetical protein
LRGDAHEELCLAPLVGPATVSSKTALTVLDIGFARPRIISPGSGFFVYQQHNDIDLRRLELPVMGSGVKQTEFLVHASG